MVAIRRLIQKALIFLIRFYQIALSPLFGQHCRFYPSCSQYMIDSIKHHGIFRGVWSGSLRLCRCHPLCKGGFDPVIERREKVS